MARIVKNPVSQAMYVWINWAGVMQPDYFRSVYSHWPMAYGIAERGPGVRYVVVYTTGWWHALF